MLSVIIPVYNGEKYIKRCILSILRQKLKDIEIIIVDDGSTDATKEICLGILGENIKYFRINNHGCSFARNYGIENAKGEYIGFVDADDWIDEEMYLKLYEIKDEADIVICGYRILNEKQEEINKIIPTYCENKEEYIDFKSNYFNSPCNKIYKKSLIINNNIRFLEKCHMGEDMVFNYIAFQKAKKIKILQESLYNYYLNQESAMHNPNKKNEIYIAIEEIKRQGINKKKYIECIKYHGINSPFATLEQLKEKNKEWKLYFNMYLENLRKLNKDLTINLKLIIYYRIFRLKCVFIKKILKKYKKSNCKI